ncbi:MAG: hypothetical protein JNJ46_01355 [Myxococcales bacterium]|nr:hypothetical protein [Myxococcales bacterium]
MSVDRAWGWMRTCLRCLAWLIALSLAGSPVATAHPQFGPATINRYGRLVLTAPDRARLFYTVMVGDIPALRLRQSVDADHSGHLDTAEQAALQAKIAEQVQQGLSLQSGPHRVALTWDSAQLSLGDAAVSARALSFDATAVSQPPATQTAESLWRYQDQVPLAPAGEVELRVEEAPGVWLRGSQGPARSAADPPLENVSKAGPARLFQVYNPAEARSTLTVELDVATHAPASSRAAAAPRHDGAARLRWLAGFALFLLLAVAAARWATRRSA